MLTAEQLEIRRFDLANSLAHQRMEGIEVDEKFLAEITAIMETVEEADVSAALEELKQRLIRGDVF